MTPVVDHALEEYAGQAAPDMPLGAYALLLATFTAGFGTVLHRAARRKRLPRQIAAGDIVLLGLATHKLTRLISRDRVTAVVRFPFTRFERTAGAGEVEEEPRGRGLRRAVGTLLTCPFCVGPWIASFLTAGLLERPRETRVVASTLAMVTLSDFMNQLYAAARHASRRT